VGTLQRSKGSVNERLALFERKQLNAAAAANATKNDRSRGMTRNTNRARSFSSSSVVKQSTVAWPPPSPSSSSSQNPSSSQSSSQSNNSNSGVKLDTKLSSEKIQEVRAMFEKKSSDSGRNTPLILSRGESGPISDRGASHDKEENGSNNGGSARASPSSPSSSFYNNNDDDDDDEKKKNHNRRVGHALGDNIYKKWMTDKFAAADEGLSSHIAHVLLDCIKLSLSHSLSLSLCFPFC
jgi:hypothetical protein